MNDESNRDIRDRVESLLIKTGYSVCEAGYGFWKVTTPANTTRCISLRIKSSSTLHRKTQSLEYGLPQTDWQRLISINATVPAAIMIFDKSDGTLSYGTVANLEGGTRLWGGDGTVYVPKSRLKVIAKTPSIRS